MGDGFSVSLGQGADGPVSLSKKARDTHLHLIGLSGQGKSYLIEHMMRQDIENGAGVCLIDPHGEVYRHMCDWLSAGEWHRTRRIHLINPADGHWSIGFNPLSLDDPYIPARVGAMIEGCQKVWGDEESTGHKTLANLLEMVFTTLAFHKLSLMEAPLLTSLQHRETRQRLVEATGDAGLIDKWNELDFLKTNEFVTIFSAVTNRMRALTGSPGVAEMLGQTEDVIDFKLCMDRGDVILVNLNDQGRVPPQVAQTVGALITADLFRAAKQRDVDRAGEAPFYCYIDECGEYLNETVIHGLDQTRKYGLHYILSHQRLAHLGDSPNHPIRNGVMNGAQSKIVFLQEDRETTGELGELLFGKTFDLERPKEVLIKPTVVGYSREWLEAEGEAFGKFEAETSGSMSGVATGTSALDIENAIPVMFETESSGDSNSSNSGTSRIQSRSWHEALVPILEDLPGGVYSLEELKHEAAVAIRLLQKRQAFAYRADDRLALQFATADVHPARPTAEQNQYFYDTVRRREPSAKRPADVQRDVSKRRAHLTGDVVDTLDPDACWEDVDSS
ncbi:DUF87 domain-containing protein [Parasphingopyxis sp.]|uniref:type IV secretory system conjugative DNA transfer family protein n=1 Tax=Parasphingopyxis sp. TaxID=1920299 RepID=UPI002605DD35|nr:DUF87 domain-containing protein [Parasphingopyxis sp.]